MAKNDLEFFRPRATAKGEGHVLGVNQRDGMTFVQFNCDRLGADGRCTDYENRPFTCRDFKPGTDRLCAEYVHKLNGIPIVVHA